MTEDLNNEQLIDIVRSLVGPCITMDDATHIISRLLVAHNPTENFDYTAQTKGIGILASRNLISREQAISWSKTLAEKNMETLISIPGRKSPKPSEKSKGPRKAYEFHGPRMFASGELSDALAEAIGSGHDTVDAIITHVQTKTGYARERLSSTIYGRLSGLVAEGKFESYLDADGVKHWRVLEYGSAKQAGLQGFISKKEIEKELGR